MVWYLAKSTTFLVISHPSITNKDSHIPKFNTVHYGKHSVRYFGPYTPISIMVAPVNHVSYPACSALW